MYRKFAATALVAASWLACSDALGVAQRTFVSASSGIDTSTAFNCSLANPCRSFAAAMTVTAPNGEIVVLDSGGYGRVTIDKSVSITSPGGVYAGISVFAGFNGIDILTDGISVSLRGLTINGQGGLNGVFANAANLRLRIEACVIANLSGLGTGGLNLHSAGGVFSLKDTVVRDSNSGIKVSGGRAMLVGVLVEGNSFDGIDLLDTQASIAESTSSRNGGSGLLVDSGSSADTVIAVADTMFSGNAQHGVSANSNGSSNTLIAITRSTVSANSQTGVAAFAGGTGALRVEVVDSTVKASGASGLAIVRTSGAAASVFTATGNLVSGNGGRGLLATGTDIYAIASRNTMTMNTGVGLEQQGSAVLESTTDNVVRGNNFGLAQTAGTITPITGL